MPPADSWSHQSSCHGSIPSMTYDALRKGRRSIPHQIYTVTIVTHGRTRWFEDLYLGRHVVNTLRCIESNDHARSLA